MPAHTPLNSHENHWCKMQDRQGPVSPSFQPDSFSRRGMIMPQLRPPARPAGDQGILKRLFTGQIRKLTYYSLYSVRRTEQPAALFLKSSGAWLIHPSPARCFLHSKQHLFCVRSRSRFSQSRTSAGQEPEIPTGAMGVTKPAFGDAQEQWFPWEMGHRLWCSPKLTRPSP